MALTMGPAVSRASQRSPARIAYAAAMFVGVEMAYAAVAGVEHLLVKLDLRVAVGVVLILVGLAILRDIGVRAPVPYADLQVAEWLRDLLPLWGVALSFGWLLGLGFVTKFTFSVHTALLLVMPLIVSPAVALGVLGVWVAARLLVTFVGGEEDPAALCVYFEQARRRLGALRLTSALSSALALALLVVTAM